jgi:hypothetical protein
MKHDASFVIRCMNYLFQSDDWKGLNIENISIWSDGGPHFKNFELVAFEMSLFNTVAKSVNFNYFVEYHGKCYCDSHFSIISRIIGDYERG